MPTPKTTKKARPGQNDVGKKQQNYVGKNKKDYYNILYTKIATSQPSIQLRRFARRVTQRARKLDRKPLNRSKTYSNKPRKPQKHFEKPRRVWKTRILQNPSAFLLADSFLHEGCVIAAKAAGKPERECQENLERLQAAVVCLWVCVFFPHMAVVQNLRYLFCRDYHLFKRLLRVTGGTGF